MVVQLRRVHGSVCTVVSRLAIIQPVRHVSNAGAPFTVATAKTEPPEEFIEDQRFSLSDQRNPRGVRSGKEPLVTVKLTFFPSGRSALAFSAAHTLMDGMSVYTFLHTWAAIARDETVAEPYPSFDQSPIMAPMLPVTSDKEQIKAQFKEATGAEMAPYFMQVLQDKMARFAIGLFDFKYLWQGPPPRLPLYLSDADLKRIKSAATPQESGAWVSTQEALCAFFLQTLGKMKAKETGVQPTKPGGVRIFRDVRPLLKLKKDHMLGVGFYLQVIKVDDYLKLSLAHVAQKIHEEYMATDLLARFEKQMGTMNWFTKPETGVPFMYGAFSMLGDSDCDMTFGLNNQSKVSLPDFGIAPDGSEQRLLTSAGPNVLLPAKGGMQVFLSPDVLPKKLPGGPAGIAKAIKDAVDEL